WMIARDIAESSNMAGRYVNEVRKNLRELNSEEAAIEKFNQALQNAENGANDMAVIQLKKVISVHPNMTKAYSLLALLYAENKKFDQAEKMLIRCLELDHGNDTASRLLRSIRSLEAETHTRSMGVSGEEERDPLIIPVRFRDYGSYLSNALYILLGLILGVLIAWFVIVPGRVDSRMKDQEAAGKSYEAVISDLQAELAAIEETRLTEAPTNESGVVEPSYEASEETMPEYPKNTTWVPNQEDVEKSVAAVNDNRYAETVERILRVDQTQLSHDNQAHYRNIIQMIFSEQVYQRMQAMAYNYYATQDYANAARYYDALSRIHPEIADYRARAGMAYEGAGDVKSAANRYWQAAVIFQNTEVGRDAAYRYVMLTKKNTVPAYTGSVPLDELRAPVNVDEILSKIGGVG
ncbi:MAG: hypothetical protein IK088_03195, partial [Lachnospiraceae bacterium]|nr:hypothetical protein [Lachnospiraceae bacterium]